MLLPSPGIADTTIRGARFLLERQRLDGHLASDDRVPAEIHDADRPLAEFALHLERAEPGLGRRIGLRLGRLGEHCPLPRVREPRLDVPVTGLSILDVAQHGDGLLGLAGLFEIAGKAAKIVEQRVRRGRFLEFLPRRVELALALVGERHQAGRFGRLRGVAQTDVFLRHAALRDKRHGPGEQQRSRQAKLQPEIVVAGIHAEKNSTLRTSVPAATTTSP